MKILMISMSSNHFFRWTEQLRDSGHEVHWIDVFDSNIKVEKIDFTHQIIGWRNKINYPGRYFIKAKFPQIHNLINKINQRDLATQVEKSIYEIQPDIVHSFILQSAATPLLEIMNKFPNIKWVYSAWGNDLYFRQQNKVDCEKIKITLPKIDYMFADCNRDFIVAQKLGFKGEYLGTFPTGGGYDFGIYDHHTTLFDKRYTILIKGYQGKLGRCNNVLKAISELKKELRNFNITVFGGNNAVDEFVQDSELKTWNNFSLLYNIPHLEVLKLMGKSMIYIGNNISDGLPNTLLESIIMGAFPIQSNPGGATAEYIENGNNGLLIENPEDVNEIKNLIIEAIKNKKSLKRGVEYNFKFIKPKLEREYIKTQVLEKYKFMDWQLNSVK